MIIIPFYLPQTTTIDDHKCRNCAMSKHSLVHIEGYSYSLLQSVVLLNNHNDKYDWINMYNYYNIRSFQNIKYIRVHHDERYHDLILIL